MTIDEALRRLRKLYEARIKAAVQSTAQQHRENAQANADAIKMAIGFLEIAAASPLCISHQAKGVNP